MSKNLKTVGSEAYDRAGIWLGYYLAGRAALDRILQFGSTCAILLRQDGPGAHGQPGPSECRVYSIVRNITTLRPDDDPYLKHRIPAPMRLQRAQSAHADVAVTTGILSEDREESRVFWRTAFACPNGTS